MSRKQDLRGLVCVVECLEQRDRPNYKAVGEIKTGPLKGSRCFIDYTGDEFIFNSYILGRVHSKYKVKKDDVLITYLTSKIPDDFDYKFHYDIITYAKWDTMHGLFAVPAYEMLSARFPGDIYVYLHLVLEGGWVTGYSIDDMHIKKKKGSKGSYTPKNALSKYIEDIQSFKFPHPLSVIIDSDILDSYYIDLLEKTGRTPIEIEQRANISIIPNGNPYFAFSERCMKEYKIKRKIMEINNKIY